MNRRLMLVGVVILAAVGTIAATVLYIQYERNTPECRVIEEQLVDLNEKVVLANHCVTDNDCVVAAAGSCGVKVLANASMTGPANEREHLQKEYYVHCNAAPVLCQIETEPKIEITCAVGKCAWR